MKTSTNKTFLIIAPIIMLGAALVVYLNSLNHDKGYAEMSSPNKQFSVYDSVESCKAEKGEMLDCGKLFDKAESLANSMTWPFDSKQECIDSFGTSSCYQSEAQGEWKVKMVGMALLSEMPGFESVIPVVHSDIYPGYYFPNGYPVVMGANTASKFDVVGATLYSTKTRSLNDELCVEDSFNTDCRPLNEHLQSLYLAPGVAKAIFKN